MALKDLQSVKVKPGEEDQVARLRMSFGWELKNKQRVKTADSQKYTHQDSNGTKYYETTPGVDFIELTFERDPERKNYAELKSLEGQYDSVRNPTYPEEVPKRFGCLWLVLSVIGLVAFVVPGVLIIVWRFVRYSKKKKVWDEAYAAYNKELEAAKNKRQELLQRAQSLV
jgi:hypothetical protein